MGVLAPRLRTLDRSARPPIDTGNTPTFFVTIFGVDKATFSELDLPRFAEGFLAQSLDAQKGRNFFQVWIAKVSPSPSFSETWLS